MRSLVLSLALVVGVVGVANAQDPAALAVQSCAIAPTEGPAARTALQEFVDYITANPIDLPAANVYGVYRQRVNDTANIRLIVEVESVAAWGTWNSARREANRSDERRGALWQAFQSHLVPQSCNWSFHQRWP